ncbi:MAG: carboxymuconolactone decarboxylase family protein [Ignavibacteriae bacterium]|nr:carboxymuconolactone decarboxylase family protein [Ignavibacteriota bacterium]
MSRIKKVELEKASAEQKELLEGIKNKIGKVPNIYAGIAQSTAALKAYLSFADNLQKGMLDGKTREIIALAVAQYNGCDYCLSAHSFMGSKMFGMTEQQIRDFRLGKASDPKTQALLTFVIKVVDQRGGIDDSDYQQIRGAGYSEAEIVEILANIVQTIFTNYFNHIAQTEIDFPVVSAIDLKQVA